VSFLQGTASAWGAPGDGRATRRLLLAVAASIVLHLLLALALRTPRGIEAPVPPPPLVARLAPAPKPAVPAPPPVLKDTLQPPKPELLEDYIKPRERRVITDQPQAQPKTPAPIPPKPAPPPRSTEAPAAPKPPAPVAQKPPAPEPVQKPPAPEPKPAAPPPASSPLAAVEPAPRRPLDLSIPQDARSRSPERLSPQELSETLTRLSETMLYPSEALRRGLEGEVVIMVEIGDGGRILGAEIASGSGHPVLDDAAVRAVRRLGNLGPTTAHRTILLPVRFRIL
jgi:protein TonB